MILLHRLLKCAGLLGVTFFLPCYLLRRLALISLQHRATGENVVGEKLKDAKALILE